MKRVLTGGVIFSTLLLLLACSASIIKGSGKIITENREVISFDQIKVSSDLAVKVIANEPQSLAVTTDDNLQPYIVTTVRGHTLNLSIKPDYKLSSTHPIQITIAVPKLKKVTTADAVRVNMKGIEGKEFKLYVSNTSTVNAMGKVTRLSIGMSGTGQVDTRNLLAERVGVDVNGAGKAIVYVSKELVVKISGKGVVTYYGNPPVVNRAVFGGGQVQKAAQAGD